MASPKILSKSVDQAAATTATIIAALSGHRIQVMGFCLSVENGALGAKSTLQDETANTVRFTMKSEAATSVVVYAYGSPNDDVNAPVFETAVGEGLELVSGTAALVAGVINYRYVKGA